MRGKALYDGLLTDHHFALPPSERDFDAHFEVKDASYARGRFAQVRRCVHRQSQSECAAKVLRKKRRLADASSEILHEVRVLLLCNNQPHVVQLLQLFESGSEFILVLELAAGGELQRVLDEHESLPESHVVRFTGQLLHALNFLHQRRIAHLDIKPQNILLTAPYPDGNVKLCDFGISRLIDEGAELREIVGTPDYVAPEVLNYEPITLSTDMWSMGVLAYVLLSGYSPFGGDCKQETYLNITQAQLDFPSKLFADVSQDAIDFISALIRRKPTDRLSCEQALNHHWLKCKSSKALLDVDKGTPTEIEPMNTSSEPEVVIQTAELAPNEINSSTLDIQTTDINIQTTTTESETEIATANSSDECVVEESIVDQSQIEVKSNPTTDQPHSLIESCLDNNHQPTTSAELKTTVSGNSSESQEESNCLKKSKQIAQVSSDSENVEPKKKRTLSDSNESQQSPQTSQTPQTPKTLQPSQPQSPQSIDDTKTNTEAQEPPDEVISSVVEPLASQVKVVKANVESKLSEQLPMEVHQPPPNELNPTIVDEANKDIEQTSTSSSSSLSSSTSSVITTEILSLESSEPCSLEEEQTLIDEQSQSPVELTNTVCSILGSVLNSVSNAEALKQPSAKNGPIMNALACAL